MDVKLRPKGEVLRMFGLTVRAYRLQAELTQEKLAERAGVDRTYVGGVERGGGDGGWWDAARGAGGAAADRGGVARAEGGGVGRGERNVGLLNLVRLADALEISPALLLERFTA